MSMNNVPLDVVIADFRIGIDGDDHISNVSDIQLRNIALRGIRDLGFDMGRRIKSLKLAVNSNDTITLPDDFVSISKIGLVGEDGLVYVLNENKSINFSRRKLTTTTAFSQSSMDIPVNSVKDTEESKEATTSGVSIENDYNQFVFENYLMEGGTGRLYGMGGAHAAGEYRMNYDQNRIELSTNKSVTEVVMEYISDDARSGNPSVHVYAEEALRAYIYYKLIEKKSTIPANEKARARAEYYNERRLAGIRMASFSKDEALKVIRKNYRLSPKF